MKHIPFYLALVFLAGCSPEKNYVLRVKPQQLTEPEIYNRDLVYDVVFDAQELQMDSLRNKSRQLFLKGMDQYANKKDAAGAIKLFKQSILIFPDAKTYYELGNALLDAGNAKDNYASAISAYGVAEKLGFKPEPMIDYKTAVAFAMMRKTDPNTSIYNVTGNLESAFKKGFLDTALLYADPALASVIRTEEFKSMYMQLDLEKISKNAAGNLFALYRASFQEYRQPFEITFDNVDQQEHRQSISYGFAGFIPEMENVSFGRDVSHDFFYVGKVAETPAYTAVLYSSISFWGELMQPVTTKLVTYDPAGNIIAAKIFAGQFSAEKIKVGKIENNEITLQDYKRIWKEPIDKVPFDENKVEKYELVAKATFRLTETGDIVEVSVPANYSDSVVFAKQ